MDSCAQHLAAAAQAGTPARVLHRAGIALDVDEPRDVAALLARLPASRSQHTQALLNATPLGSRISLALASLSPLSSMTTNQGKA